jgi:glycerol-3-phosphate acyltransferase PlsX
VRPDHLVQFAFMGARSRAACWGSSARGSGSCRTGSRPGKGREEVVEAHAALAEKVGPGAAFDFIGNVEGFASPPGVADVIVTDGFHGNVALKVAEGVSQAMLGYVPLGRDVVAAREGRRPAPAAAPCARCATS